MPFQGAQKDSFVTFVLLSHWCSHMWNSAKFSDVDGVVLCHCCSSFLELF